MIGESIERPKLIERTRGGLVVRFAVEVIQGSEDLPDRYRFEAVRVPAGATRGEMIDAVIGSRHSHAAEIAMLNNRDIDDQGRDDYDAYQAFRRQAKSWVDEALEGYNP